MPHDFSSQAAAAEPPAALMQQYGPLIADLKPDHPVLDLACGNGRNGLWLARQGIPVVFADRSDEALQQVAAQLRKERLEAELWPVDLEQPGLNPLAGRQFAAVLVFRYLHRPLLPMIKDVIMPGGVLIYETFTVDQPHYGRPRNPDFLLRPGELRAAFDDWHVLHDFEGVLPQPDRAVAQLVCRKPVTSG